MNPLSDISWKYYDYIRERVKSITPATNSLIDNLHHVANKFIAKNYLNIGDLRIRFSIRPVPQGFMLVLIAEPSEATYNGKPNMYSFVESDRSVLFDCFKQSIDEILHQHFNEG